MMIIFTIFLFTPMMSDSRVNALADLLGLFYIAQTGVVAAYMGATAYMAGKPMGNKTKDMR
jgi:formate hydrogenlyase subunit 4